MNTLVIIDSSVEATLDGNEMITPYNITVPDRLFGDSISALNLTVNIEPFNNPDDADTYIVISDINVSSTTELSDSFKI